LPYNGATTNATNTINDSGSWGYQILPYVEQQALYNEQTGTFPSSWNSGLSVFTCPLRSRGGYVSGTGGTGNGVKFNSGEINAGNNGWNLFIVSPGAAGWSFSVTIANNNSNIVVTGSYAMITSWTAGWNCTYGPAVPYSISPGQTLTTPLSSFNAAACDYPYPPGTSAQFPNATGEFTLVVLILNESQAIAMGGGPGGNDGGAGAFVTVYPSSPGGSGPVTDYGINPYINNSSGTINAANAYSRLNAISDGTSNTILAGHIYYALSDYPLTTPSATLMPIFAPGTLGTSRGSLGSSSATWLQDGTAATSTQWGSPMAEGGLMAMCDGSVHFFPYTVSLANFLTPDDGNPVTLP
jgi:hypothetical protein